VTLLARVAAALAGVLLSLFLCELAARISQGLPLLPLVPPEPYIDNAILYRRDASRLYELRPGVDAIVGRNAVRIHINAQGQRDDVDRPTAKPDGVYRVVVLGDSFTFAGKVPLEDTFARQLERAVARADASRRYEILNLAVPGYNTEQEMLTLKERGLAYRPDLVVVNFVLNDAGRMVQLVPGPSPLPNAVRKVLKRSDLMQMIFGFLKSRRREGTGESGKYEEFAAGTERWKATAAALEEMRNLAAAAKAELVIVVWPMLVDLGPEYPFRDKHALVVAECRRLGIPVLDLLATFGGTEASAWWATPNDHHPNGAALGAAANVVVQDLAARHLLPSPRQLP